MEILIVVVLIAASGMFSGLTIGLMGYSVDEVERLAAVGDANAKKILTLVSRGNLLLTTLLLGNTAVNAALSIFLGAVVQGTVGFGLALTASDGAVQLRLDYARAPWLNNSLLDLSGENGDPAMIDQISAQVAFGL